MDKKSLTETDIRTKFITPAILGAGETKHTKDDGPGGVGLLLPEYGKLVAQIAESRSCSMRSCWKP